MSAVRKQSFDTKTLPDFIIGGAMKSATSSLHHLLAAHENVFIPEGEIHFFCMDDAIQHPDFLFAPRDAHEDGKLDYHRNFEQKLEWYRSFFEPAKNGQLIGEDSTIYLASEKTPKRIASLLPNVKLIFMLRNPVDRTYSHYWHRVKTGRAVHPFKQELEQGPSTLHLRSIYKPQLERYFEVFERDQIKVILFERFVTKTQLVIDEVCSFLNLSPSVNAESANPHRNVSPVPRLYRLQLFLNYLLTGVESRYDDHLPGSEQSAASWFIQGLVHHLRNLNLSPDGERPQMDSTVRQRLSAFYARENEGLGNLIDAPINEYWPHT